MKNRTKSISCLFLWFLTILGTNLVFNLNVAAQERVSVSLNAACNSSLKQVQNKSFPLSKGNKQIVTYSLNSFQDNEECWRSLETIAKSITKNSEIAGVYFFTLPPDEISEIDILYKDFSQYGMNLIATYWKDPDSGSELRRYPNNTIDGK